MFGEIMVGICAVLAVGIIFERATNKMIKQMDSISKDVQDLIKKVVRIDSTYVTEEECAQRHMSMLRELQSKQDKE